MTEPVTFVRQRAAFAVWSSQQAAKKFGMDVDSFRRWAKRVHLPVSRVGRKLFFHQDVLERWFAEHTYRAPRSRAVPRRRRAS